MKTTSSNSPTIFMDISPLQELSYTGIPKVALELVKHGLTRHDVEFFWDDYIIPTDIIERLINAESGLTLHALANERIHLKPLLSRVNEVDTSVGLFPNVMTRFFFDRHAQIIHDLVFITSPEYHHADTVRHHGTTIIRDAELSDALICVSNSTAYDVKTYLQPDPQNIYVAELGASLPEQTKLVQPSETGLDKFVLIMGTIEPRKNIELALKYISQNLDQLDRYSFVFCGKDGWLISFDELVTKYELHDYVVSGKIIRLPYVSERLKWDLLNKASLLLFPSLYEGFGLPVLEGLSCGTPVLASCSSSIMESGREFAWYFDPCDYSIFEDKLNHILDTNCATPENWNANLKKYLDSKTWDNYGAQVFSICAKLK
ncbi:glycosyltransferase family 4 protein [Pseudomonas rhizosphaerae]|jgi:glycosyltransferase involved in cell wall biosynthesis|uniref:glycosyltransferase family 4 protein n=1 Tax=Pseudomonas rhizosphaerae TaxID=216142 RepID=UPI002B463401|nr:glycosyltransferase family 1 protein [Pseudomonas rhizosphaerae]MEB2869659.1 glycosyltransferase family 1 protein [Pseudomonas rhizosphaerae]